MAAGGGGSGACFGAGSWAAFPLAGGTNFAVAAAWRVVGPSNPRYEDSERKRRKKKPKTSIPRSRIIGVKVRRRTFWITLLVCLAGQDVRAPLHNELLGLQGLVYEIRVEKEWSGSLFLPR